MRLWKERIVSFLFVIFSLKLYKRIGIIIYGGFIMFLTKNKTNVSTGSYTVEDRLAKELLHMDNESLGYLGEMKTIIDRNLDSIIVFTIAGLFNDERTFVFKRIHTFNCE